MMKKLRTPHVISTAATPVISTTAGRRNLVRSKKGFTLAEMLISVLLLGLVSVMVSVMTSAVLSTTSVMQDISQAEILGTEALENIQGVLRVAYSVEIADSNSDKPSYEQLVIAIDENNKDFRLGIVDGKIILGQLEEGDEGQTVLEGDTLFSGVSYDDLEVESLKFEAGTEKREIDNGEETVVIVAVKVSVSVSRFGETIWTGNVTVRPLCGVSKIETSKETG